MITKSLINFLVNYEGRTVIHALVRFHIIWWYSLITEFLLYFNPDIINKTSDFFPSNSSNSSSPVNSINGSPVINSTYNKNNNDSNTNSIPSSPQINFHNFYDSNFLFKSTKFNNNKFIKQFNFPNSLTLFRFFLYIIVYIFVVTIIIWNHLGLFLDQYIFPEWNQIEVNSPVFIIGLTRSGSAWLHTLLTKCTNTNNNTIKKALKNNKKKFENNKPSSKFSYRSLYNYFYNKYPDYFNDESLIANSFTSINTWEIFFGVSVTWKFIFYVFYTIDKKLFLHFFLFCLIKIEELFVYIFSLKKIYDISLLNSIEDEWILIPMYGISQHFLFLFPTSLPLLIPYLFFDHNPQHLTLSRHYANEMYTQKLNNKINRLNINRDRKRSKHETIVDPTVKVNPYGIKFDRNDAFPIDLLSGNRSQSNTQTSRGRSSSIHSNCSTSSQPQYYTPLTSDYSDLISPLPPSISNNSNINKQINSIKEVTDEYNESLSSIIYIKKVLSFLLILINSILQYFNLSISFPISFTSTISVPPPPPPPVSSRPTTSPYSSSLKAASQYTPLSLNQRKDIMNIYYEAIQKHLFYTNLRNGVSLQINTKKIKKLNKNNFVLKNQIYLSKNPFLTFSIPTLYETFKDPNIICCLRDPLETIPSIIHYLSSIWKHIDVPKLIVMKILSNSESLKYCESHYLYPYLHHSSSLYNKNLWTFISYNTTKKCLSGVILNLLVKIFNNNPNYSNLQRSTSNSTNSTNSSINNKGNTTETNFIFNNEMALRIQEEEEKTGNFILIKCFNTSK